MKKFYLLTFMLFVALGVVKAAAGDNANWYLYFYSDTHGLDGDYYHQFKETSTAGVYLLEGCSVPASGINFCIHNQSWSTSYGWSKDNEGIVKEIGTAIPLGLGRNL